MSIDISNDKLIPKIAVVASVREDTPDVKTFRVVPKEGETLFDLISAGFVESAEEEKEAKSEKKATKKGAKK